MGEAKENDVYKQELLDYDKDNDKAVDAAAKPAAGTGHASAKNHSSGFTDFLLKPELLRAIQIQDRGLESRTNAWSNGPPKFLFDGRATPARRLNYEEDDNKDVGAAAKPASGRAAPMKGGVGIQSSGFRDFILTPELLRAIQNFGLEHP